MSNLRPRLSSVMFVVITMYVHACMALDCQFDRSLPDKIAYTIYVAQQGDAKFTKVQQAIDSIPSGNTKWIRIYIAFGTYKEKVEIPKDKGCIFLEGENKGWRNVSTISYGSYETTDTSSTFTAFADNIVLKNLGFENTYGLSTNMGWQARPAVAARLLGDKYAVVSCVFTGLQDTLWDGQGRHYFQNCYISGSVDFIWGSGQSLYEGCQLNVTLDPLKNKPPCGVITAQGRDSDHDESGFVFKDCLITGDATMLGRAYRAYSRVIFYRSQLYASVVSLGWDDWQSHGQVEKLTYVEAQNKGPGAKSKRVPWLKRMSASELNKFVSFSFISQDGWMTKLPPKTIS